MPDAQAPQAPRCAGCRTRALRAPSGWLSPWIRLHRRVNHTTDRHDNTDMEPTYFAQYRGFEFQCAPQRLGVGAFAPRLVIHDAYESLSLEIPIGVPTPPFRDPTAAAHQAFAHGRRWVDSGLGASPSAADLLGALSADEAPRLPG
jgi:hypothetical protein